MGYVSRRGGGRSPREDRAPWHSFISICVSKGLTLEQIAERVGHVSPKTIRLYTHFNLEDSKKRIESLGIRF